MNAATVTAAAVLCALVLSLAFASAPALAKKIFYPGVSFGGLGTGEGQLNKPAGIAVNPATGDVYVADDGNDRIEYFSAAGAYEGQFNGSGALPNEEGKKAGSGGLPHERETGQFSSPSSEHLPNEVAVDGSGDVYVMDTGNLVIDKYDSKGKYLSQITGGMVCSETVQAPPCTGSEHEEFRSFASLRGLVVDTDGNLWVYGGLSGDNEGSHAIGFTPSGNLMPKANFSTEAASHSNRAIAVDTFETTSLIFVGVYLGMEVEWLNGEGNVFDRPFGSGVAALTVVPSTAVSQGDGLADDLLVGNSNQITVYKLVKPPRELLPGEISPTPGETIPGEDVPAGYEGLSDSAGLSVNGDELVNGVATTVLYASEQERSRVESFDYVSVPSVTTDEPSGVSATGMTLTGTVNPGGEKLAKCYFEYGTEAGVYDGSVDCKPLASEITGASPVAVSAEVSGLLASSVRSFRLVAESAAGVKGNGLGLTVSSPRITGAGVVKVGSSSGLAVAEVGPGGLEACYSVESCLHKMVGKECIPIPSGQSPVPVSVELTGLAPATEYCFQIVAFNVLGAETSNKIVFTTFAPTSSELPDGRAYELVSEVPVGAVDETYVPQGMLDGLDLDNEAHGIATPLPFMASADGETVSYLGAPPPEGGDGQVGTSSGNQFVARRAADGQWNRADIEPSGYGNIYMTLSSDLSVGVLRNPGEPLAPAAPEGYVNLYRRSIGWAAARGAGFEPVLGSFEPTITVAPMCETQEFGTEVNGYLAGTAMIGDLVKQVFFGGGNAGVSGVPAFSDLLFEANAALPAKPHPDKPVGCGIENDLYEWAGGQLWCVNVLPDGESKPGATFGREGLDPNGKFAPETDGAVSADGSRVFWSSVKLAKHESGPYENGNSEVEELPTALYVRENATQPQSKIVGEDRCSEPARACTVRMDIAEPGVSQPADCLVVNEGEEEDICEHPAFWAASSDGSRVLFTDESRLTSDATAQLDKPDLYEYDLEAPEGKRLTDLSVPFESGSRADVQGVMGTSEDGSYVYFVAGGVLTVGENAEVGEPAEGEPNLYVWHEGRTAYIATLEAADGDFTEGVGGNDGDWQADPGHRTAEVTPDGQSVVFMSRRRLGKYDNVVGGTSLAEVYTYNAVAGRLACVSCNPSGERPTANIYPEFAREIGGEQLRGSSEWVWGSFVPVSESLADYQPRVISDDGDRVFFDSLEPLVPRLRMGF